MTSTHEKRHILANLQAKLVACRAVIKAHEHDGASAQAAKLALTIKHLDLAIAEIEKEIDASHAMQGAMAHASQQPREA